MKSKALIIILVLGITTIFISCKTGDEKIIGKWQHILIVGNSTQGSDTLDMTQYPPTFNTFRQDKTLLITNGQQEVNVRYFIRDNKLYSYQLGSEDTSIMNIKKLTNKELILEFSINDETQRVESLHYVRKD
ncbi:MAG: hypothetical protein PHO12_00200 [Bacteroidales bacterium]|nr:hypothetical protein [Bacteroidales bacterium]MDD4684655.1 hypothetical protein [Bacteroidales bacterium]